MARKILCIDDEPAILNIIKKRLESRHYEVLTASNGLSGIQQAKESKPDIILLDILMPGMDGHETCKRLKADEVTKGIPVIFFSCDIKVGVQTQCLEEGAVGIVLKPDLYELFPAIESVLSGKKIDGEGFD